MEELQCDSYLAKADAIPKPFLFDPISSKANSILNMRVFTAVIERCADTGFYVGFVPGFPGAHSQGNPRVLN